MEAGERALLIATCILAHLRAESQPPAAVAEGPWTRILLSEREDATLRKAIPDEPQRPGRNYELAFMAGRVFEANTTKTTDAGSPGTGEGNQPDGAPLRSSAGSNPGEPVHQEPAAGEASAFQLAAIVGWDGPLSVEGERAFRRAYNAGKAVGEREERERLGLPSHADDALLVQKALLSRIEELTGKSPLSESAGAKCSHEWKLIGVPYDADAYYRCSLCSEEHGREEHDRIFGKPRLHKWSNEGRDSYCRACGVHWSARNDERRPSCTVDWIGTGRSPELTPGQEGKR